MSKRKNKDQPKIQDKRNVYVCTCNNNGIASCTYHFTLAATGSTPDELMDEIIESLKKDIQKS